MTSPWLITFWSVFSLLVNSQAAEAWADPKLPPANGLELWFDASVENRARNALGLQPIASGGSLDIWHDASGHQRHLTQRLPSARPRLQLSPTTAFLIFDGKDDSLDCLNLHQAFTNLTVFLVAAPRSNLGMFRALFAINQSGRNDYVSGMNIDLGPGPSTQFEHLNVEGNGFGGAKELLLHPVPFGHFHLFAVTSAPGPGATQVHMDTLAEGQRDRADSVLWMDELTVGARCYSNDPEPPYTQGFFDGAIAEVLVFNRVLPKTERAQIETYLSAKYHGAPPLAAISTPLRRHIENSPPVQMLVPGFTARELPLQLNNINNVKYRADGKLVALGYNGRIYLLSDTNAGGLENHVQTFWDQPTLRAPIGMALTPPNYPRGQGVFVASKGKVSLIVDTNNDDVADQEIVVASGWPELHHGVDALGVAIDPSGNVYFGLGTANFTDPYLRNNSAGQSHYDLKNERGTILKVSPDFQHREIICTGIRFPVALAFHPSGDLFCTDQEGATWLPNGNPFDELLHIQPGRHYGFPPRHPKYLPSVIDEPSVFDYAPQHQSTCGLNFNLPINGGSAFGPAGWAGDAMVSGYSRGKIFRTKLVATEPGYVAQSQIIACLTQLTVDACVSPSGDLVVATHGGLPDWGSGPDGPGKLFKISYRGRDVPQPLFTWAASPSEIDIAFDRPLDPALLKQLSKRAFIECGKYVSAGDEFESLRPPYQAVQDQLASPVFNTPVLSASLSSDQHVLALAIPHRTTALHYGISLPAVQNPANSAQPGEIAQRPILDLSCDLTGIEARWQNPSGVPEWNGWLPHADLQAAREFTAGSAIHSALWTHLRQTGTLILRTQLDLVQMLQPALQPGTHLDYSPTPEQVTIDFVSSAPLTLKTPELQFAATPSGEEFNASITHLPQQGRWLPVEIQLPTTTHMPFLKLSWHTADDPRPRALPLRRFLLPWASPANDQPTAESSRQIPELAGGNWLHGKRLFYSEQIGCFKCHQIHGQGGNIGPDLSNLVFRDYPSVRRDIEFPSAAINPDHLAYTVDLKNGESITGVLQKDTAAELLVGIATGVAVSVPRSQVMSIRASSVSLMPEGLLRGLDPQQIKDLFTFLLTAPLEPAPIEAVGEPPPRPLSILQSILKPLPFPPSEPQPLRVLLAAGPKDHGPGEHDYPLWQKRWQKLLRLADNVEVGTAFDFPSPNQFQNSDVVVFYSDNPSWSSAHAADLDSFLNRGGGLVYLHYAVDGHQDPAALSQRIGLAWRGGASKFRHGPLDLKFLPHPITEGLDQLHLVDESYWNLVGDLHSVQLLATGMEEGRPQPLFWIREQSSGRIFVSIPGHYTWTFDDPLFRLLLLRGISWAAHQPVDRLSELASIGARHP